jgi:hypothetical protein
MEGTVRLGTALQGLCAVAMGFVFPAAAAGQAQQDLQLWNLADLQHSFDDRWRSSFQWEIKFADDISEFSELILKPAGTFNFSPKTSVGLGYTYQVKHNDPNEQDIWQELHHTLPIKDVSLTNQFRLEERFLDSISGIIPRLRYLVQAKHPLGSTKYLVASEAIEFNLVDKGQGPVGGFEQNQVYVAIGFKWGKYTRIETGYLWKYERRRDRDDASDHVIRLRFLFGTRGRHPPEAGN